MLRTFVATLLFVATAACATGPRVPPAQLDSSDLNGTARLYDMDVAECYELEGRLQGTSDMALEAHFVITPDGHTKDVVVLPEAAGRGALGSCLVRSLVTWQFPTFTGPAMNVVIPIYAPRQRSL